MSKETKRLRKRIKVLELLITEQQGYIDSLIKLTNGASFNHSSLLDNLYLDIDGKPRKVIFEGIDKYLHMGVDDDR